MISGAYGEVKADSRDLRLAVKKKKKKNVFIKSTTSYSVSKKEKFRVK